MDKYKELHPTYERDVLNSIKFWFPKIRDCGIRVPETLIFDTTPDLIRAFYMENAKDDYAMIDKFISETVEPAIKKAGLGLVFLKNGGVSGKFDAGHNCLPHRNDLTNAVISIMQTAMECCGFQYDGTDCLAVRQRILHNRRTTPCIYGGLPFRTEYRAFYDFDTRQGIFIHDYWDKDYVYPHLYDLTDKIVFDAHYPIIHKKYEKNKDAVLSMVASAMNKVEGLSGPWSVDVLEGEKGTFWLIDMAVAEMSAYWEFRPGAEPHPAA